MLCHAVLSTAMVKSATAKEADSVKKAAKAEAFGEAIELLETELGNSFSAVPNMPKTAFIADRSMIPRNNH